MTGCPLYLMRHARPELHGRLLGWTDALPLAAAVDDCLHRAEGLDVKAIVTSDLQRSRLVAERIAGAHGLPLRIDPRWREIDFGAWDGKDPDEIDPQALARFWADPDRSPPPGGERWSQLVDRIGAALNDIDEPSLVVTHGGAIRAALHLLCGFELAQLWSFDLPYAARVDLRIWRGVDVSAQMTGLRT